MADLHCRRCHALLPVTVSDDGRELRTADGETRNPFLLRCRVCKAERLWHQGVTS